MIRLINFTFDGTNDIDFLKNSDINLVRVEDSELARALTIILGNEFYPRVSIKKGLGYKIRREVYSGYLLLDTRINKGDICTITDSELNNINYEEVNVSKELISSIYQVPSNSIRKDDLDTLTNAKLVFLVGRGIKNKENYEKIKNLAKRYGAEIACTRPVCMNNIESFDRFVGISGKALNADLVVTFGVGGAEPLIHGLDNVKKIVSVNNDKDALIFKYSDYGIIEDLNKICKELTDEYK